MTITNQQRLVLDQQQRLSDTIDRSGEQLDNKAAVLLQAGGLLIALTGATVLPDAIAASVSPWTLAGVALGFLLFIAMIACAMLAWRPQNHMLVGAGADWDSFFDDYISKDVDDAYNQVLQNLLIATDYNRAANARKARLVELAGWLFALQVAGILVLAVVGALP